MQLALLMLPVLMVLMPPAHAQGAPTGNAKAAARGANMARMPVDALCAKLTPDKVTAIMGKNFVRRTDGEELFRECKYGDSKDKQRVRYFSLGSFESGKTEASWRKEIESGGKGKVSARDGLLVGDRRGNGFDTFDSIWFRDRQGRALYLTVNSGITEDQAVALAKAAMD